MIEIKNEKDIDMFCQLNNGDIFEWNDGICKNTFYIKTKKFHADDGNDYNSMDIMSGNFAYFSDDIMVSKVKLICEVKYL